MVTTHLHITSWVLALILFLVVLAFSNQAGKEKTAKILHMVLRLDYLLILYSGGDLFAAYSSMSGELIIKAIAGLWVIVAMEMISVKTQKGAPTKAWWIQFVIALLIAIMLGFGRLGLGMAWFL
ncbi:YisL family protein [Salinibacillus xinjiangensis]|uniref:YisL family protein n=1 Tax=Salinibacillus xinjiangensis TaxID=1229268 RepID=UPI002B27A152|nr:YisL family protein [Salinibacillus xinjiangensis]